MRFRYLRDPVFLAVLAIYLINKFALKPHTANAFVHGYVADCICIPFWVPIMLVAMRRVGLRSHDDPPQIHEILIPLVVWSCAFEIILPQTEAMRGIAVADPLDVLSYTGGALVAAITWRWIYRQAPAAADPADDIPH